MPESIRCFIAFDLDDEAVLGKMTQIQAVLRDTGAHLKLVKPSNIHATLRFLGNITPTMVEKVSREMCSVWFEPFDVKIHGVGAFPHLGHPRVVWAGIAAGDKQLQSIFNQLEPRLNELGFKTERRGFSPHLTIARVKSGRNKTELAEAIRRHDDFEFGKIRAECLKLKRSNLTPKGPIYSTLEEHCPQH